MSNLKFCYVKKRDKPLVFKWRNSKLFNQFLLKKKIKLSEHNKSFDEKLKKNDSFAWIVIFNKEKIGLVQLEKLKKKTCNAGFYIIQKKYSYLTFLIINLLHYKVFIELGYRVIESYINIKNKKIRKLNKMSGYKESKKKGVDFICTKLTNSNWLKSFGYKYLKGNYGNI